MFLLLGNEISTGKSCLVALQQYTPSIFTEYSKVLLSINDFDKSSQALWCRRLVWLYVVGPELFLCLSKYFSFYLSIYLWFFFFSIFIVSLSHTILYNVDFTCIFVLLTVYEPHYFFCSEICGLIWVWFWRLFNPWLNQTMIAEILYCLLQLFGLVGVDILTTFLWVSRRESSYSIKRFACLWVIYYYLTPTLRHFMYYGRDFSYLEIFGQLLCTFSI